MSTRIMSDCWPLAMSPAQKSVLISLADQANDDGVCWPSIGTVALRTCLTDRAVRKAVRELESMGILVSNGRSGRSTYYTITVENFVPPVRKKRTRKAAVPRNEVPPTPEPHSAPESSSPGTTFPPPRNEVPPTPEPDSGDPGTTFPQNRKEPSLNHQRTVREGHASAPAPLGEKSPAKKSTRGTRLPSDWQPGPEFFSAAHEIHPRLSNLQVVEIANRFRDYWVAESGQRAVKLDWLATWRNWVRRERGIPAPPPGNPGSQPTRDVSAAEIATDTSW